MLNSQNEHVAYSLIFCATIKESLNNYSPEQWAISNVWRGHYTNVHLCRYVIFFLRGKNGSSQESESVMASRGSALPFGLELHYSSRYCFVLQGWCLLRSRQPYIFFNMILIAFIRCHCLCWYLCFNLSLDRFVFFLNI